MNKSLHKKSKSYDIFSIRESKSASFPIFPLGSYSDYPYLNPIDTGAVVEGGGWLGPLNKSESLYLNLTSCTFFNVLTVNVIYT